MMGRLEELGFERFEWNFALGFWLKLRRIGVVFGLVFGALFCKLLVLTLQSVSK
jgi:hypothetical protein